MDIYLLRHGETDWNKKRLLQGHTDIPLNEKGRAQVDDTVRRLSELGVRMDTIVSSPLKRARETAEIAAHRLDYLKEKIVVEELLMERGFGEGEGMTLDDMKAKYPDSDCPGMESKEELVRRAGQAFQKIAHVFLRCGADSSDGTRRGSVRASGGGLCGADSLYREGGMYHAGQYLSDPQGGRRDFLCCV